MVTNCVSWKSSHIDILKSSGVSVSLKNFEFKVFIFIWSLKLEGGSSYFREGIGWRKVQRLAHRGIKFVSESSLEMHSKSQMRMHSRGCVAMNVISHSITFVLKTESGHWAPF